jgi:hypothetical protein
MIKPSTFSIKNISWLVVLALLLRVTSSSTANLSYFLIAVYALHGRSQAIQAFALSWLFSMLNPAIAPDASAAAIGRYLVIAAAAISVTARGVSSAAGLPNSSVSGFTLFLGVFMLMHSLLFSAVGDVSVLKVLSWMVVVLTLLSAWQGLAPAQRIALFDQLLSWLIWLLLLSLPLLVIPSIGYLRNGTGFQGLLSQPQAFGPTVALVGALVGGRVMGDQRPAWRDIFVFGLSLVLIVLSEARTAGLALILGLLISAFLSPAFAGVSAWRMLPGLRSRRFQAVALLVVAGIITGGSFLSDTVTNYLYKRSDTTSLFDAADASRGALIEEMFVNIQENPWTGIGFGIASDPGSMDVQRDPVLDLPISALVEKGVMPLAVVEELGILGALAVFGWFLVVFRRGARSGVPQFAVLITLVLVNLGESMFFSVGGMGMLLLILLTGAVTGSEQLTGELAHA